MALRVLLFAFVVCLLTRTGVSHRAHHCIHGSAEIQRLMHDGILRTAPQKSRAFAPLEIGAVRIAVSSIDLDNTTKHCVTAGQVISNFKGGSVVCTDEDILSAEKKNILRQNILPAAVEKLASFIHVQRLTENLVVPPNVCGEFIIPPDHSEAGVSHTDFSLYVAAAPSSEGNLAWAATCASDPNGGRPIVGRANFAPRFIEWSTTDKSINEGQIVTAVHELLHAFGFSYAEFDRQYIAEQTLRGKTVKILTSPAVQRKAREYFDCDSLLGGELEDEGTEGSALSHWDARIFKNDIMTAAGGWIISNMTLAALQDTGYYYINFAAAEEMKFAKGAGCAFSNEKCDTVGGGKDKWWCFAEAQSCTTDYHAVGSCSVKQYQSPLPPYFQYFPSDPTKGGNEFVDFCPSIEAYSNRICDRARDASRDEIVFGYYFGTDGRCFDTTGLIQSGYQTSGSNTFRCLKARCAASGTRIQFQVSSSGWLNCPFDGTAGLVGAPGGFSGQIKCPAAAEFCDDELYSVVGSEPPPSSNTPVPATVTSIPAIKATATRSATITLSGSGWGELLVTDSARNAVSNALRADLANLLAVPVANIDVTRMVVGSLIVDFSVLGLKNPSDRQLRETLEFYIRDSTWLDETKSVYHSVSLDEIELLNAQVIIIGDAGDSACGGSLTKAECDTLIIVAAVGVAAIIVVYVLCFCCCRRKRRSPEGHARAPYE